VSNADTRLAIAAAVSTVTNHTGYARRPTVPKPGDAWPQWRGNERADGFAFVESWAVLIMLPSEEVSADEWADTYGEQLLAALEPVMFVDQLQPAVFKLSNNDAYALMITGRTE
jgi:hypothetical protein